MENYLPTFNISWIVENKLAISPILPIDAVEEVSERFNTIVSLSPPFEYALTVGYNPQSIMEKTKFYWIPTAKYNAPTLLELTSLVEILDKDSEPVLVTSYRGCGRSAIIASSWLIRYKKIGFIDSLLHVRRKRGCSIETKIQESVIRCYNYSIKAGIIGDLMSNKDRYDPLYEYLVHLAWGIGAKIGRNSAEFTAQIVKNHSHPLVTAARVLKHYFNYRIFSIAIDTRGKTLRLLLEVWIPRKAHFSSIVAPLDVDKNAVEKELRDILLEYIINSKLAKEVSNFELIVNEYKPREIPWY